MRDRYYIVGVSGYTIADMSGQTGSKPPLTSYSILDRYANHAEVGRFYASKRLGGGDRHRYALAWIECERLNALDRLQPYVS